MQLIMMGAVLLLVLRLSSKGLIPERNRCLWEDNRVDDANGKRAANGRQTGGAREVRAARRRLAYEAGLIERFC